MHVVDFSRNHGGAAGTAHLIDEVCPKEAPGRIEHPGCCGLSFSNRRRRCLPRLERSPRGPSR